LTFFFENCKEKMKIEYSRERLWNYEHEQVFDFQILSPEARSSDESRNSVKDGFGIDDSRKNLVYFSFGGPSFQYYTLKSILDAFNITTYSVPSVVPKLYRNFSLFYPSINCIPSKDSVSIADALHSVFSCQELLNYINKEIVYKSISESYSPKTAKSKYSLQKIPSPIRLIVLENIQSLLLTTGKKKEKLQNLNFIFNLTDSLPSAEKTVVLLTLDDSQLSADESDPSQKEKTIRTLVDFKEYLGEQLFHSAEESYFNGNALVGRINRFAIEGKKRTKKNEEAKDRSGNGSDTLVVARDDDNTPGDSFCSQLVKELQSSSSSSFHRSDRPVLTREMIKREDFMVLFDNNNNIMNTGRNNNNTNSVFLFLPYLLIIASILVFLFFTIKTNTGKKNKKKEREDVDEDDYYKSNSNNRTGTNNLNTSSPTNISPKEEEEEEREKNDYQLNNNRSQRSDSRSNNDQEDDEYFHEEKEEGKEIDKEEKEEIGDDEEFDDGEEEEGDQSNKKRNSSNDNNNSYNSNSNIGNSNRRRTSEEWNEGYFHEEEEEEVEARDDNEFHSSRRNKTNTVSSQKKRKNHDNNNPFTSNSSSSFPTQSEPPIPSFSSSSSSFPSSSHKSPSTAPSLFVSPSAPSQRRRGDHLDLSSEKKKTVKKTTTATTPGQSKTKTTPTTSSRYNQAAEQAMEGSSVTSSGGGMRLRSRRELPPP
jgi:hypothetical protein